MKKIIAVGAFCLALIIVVISINFQKISNPSLQDTLQKAIDIDSALVSEAEHPLRHLACIMDGNRRWAKKRGLVPWYGHAEGVQTFKNVVKFCMQKRISYLTVYTFSLENFKRSENENKFLFELMIKEAQKGVAEFNEHGIRLRFLGERNLFPKDLQLLLDQVEQDTAANTNLVVTFLLGYGGQQEIVTAAKEIAHKVATGQLKEEDITPELFNRSLWTGDLPDPDLIIRTGGFSRLSNFLLYKAAYSEIYVADCMWPDLSIEHLQKAYDWFMQTKRNFGT